MQHIFWCVYVHIQRDVISNQENKNKRRTNSLWFNITWVKELISFVQVSPTLFPTFDPATIILYLSSNMGVCITIQRNYKSRKILRARFFCPKIPLFFNPSLQMIWYYKNSFVQQIKFQVKARSMQDQGKVRARSRQGQWEVH